MAALARRLLTWLQPALEKASPLLLALDGRCGAGKTTLAAQLQAQSDCCVVPMDHFFLRPAQRTPRRLATPGGDVDYERFAQEVLSPLLAGVAPCYCPYDCQAQCLGPPIVLPHRKLTVVEGSYSCHPALWDFYGKRIFLDVTPEEQLRRLRLRCADSLPAFQTMWIPKEELYFSTFQIRQRCDLILSTDPGVSDQ